MHNYKKVRIFAIVVGIVFLILSPFIFLIWYHEIYKIAGEKYFTIEYYSSLFQIYYISVNLALIRVRKIFFCVNPRLICG